MTRQYIAGRWTAAWLLMIFVAAPGSASTTTDNDLKRDVENRLSVEPQQSMFRVNDERVGQHRQVG